MKRKKIKKLSLKKETITQLNNNELRKAQGGGYTHGGDVSCRLVCSWP
jgi:natural product precursor